VLNDLVIRTSNVSQQVHVTSNSNVGLRISNDTVFVQSNLRSWSVAAPVMNASNLITSNVTSCNLVSSNCTFGAVTVTGSLSAPGMGGLGTAVVQDLRHPNSNAQQFTGLPWGFSYVQRPLNTVACNTNSNVLGLSNNNIWVVPGTYLVTCQGSAYASSNGNVSQYVGYVLVNNTTGASNHLFAIGDQPPTNNFLKSTCIGQLVVQTSAPSNALVFAQYSANANSHIINGNNINTTLVVGISNNLSTVTLQRLA
jgi:hypothetical protein